MQIPNISLAYQIADLKPVLEGSILRKVQGLENGWLKLRFQTRQGTKDLIAAPGAIFFTSYSMPARQQTSGYGAFLRKHLSNKRVVSLEHHGFDRVVVMSFESFLLVFELFAKGNILLLDKSMKILSAFRREQWKDRALKKGAEYKFPASKGINPKEVDYKALKIAFSGQSLEAVRLLVRTVNIAPSMAEEALAIAGIDKGKMASSLNESELKALAKEVNGLYSVNTKKYSPVLVEKDEKQVLLPFNVTGARPLQGFGSINQGIDSFYSSEFSEAGTKPESDALERKKAELEKSLERQLQAKESLVQKAGENSRKAELIYENYTSLFALLKELSSLEGQKIQEKDIMYKLKSGFPFLKKLDLKNRRLVASFEK